MYLNILFFLILKLKEKLDDQIKKNEELIKKKREDLLFIKKKRAKSEKNDAATIESNLKLSKLKFINLRQRLNEINANNLKLRREIDSLREEKNFFNTIFDQLHVEIDFKKDHLKALINESNQAKEDIYVAREELIKAKMKSNTDKKIFDKEFGELDKVQESTFYKDASKSKQYSSILDSNFIVKYSYSFNFLSFNNFYEIIK